MEFRYDTRDLQFIIKEWLPSAEVFACDRFKDNFSVDDCDTYLSEGYKIARRVVAPINAPGDRAGVKLEDGVVTPAPGYAEAYKFLQANGWGSSSECIRIEGGMPLILYKMIHEMNTAACPAITSYIKLTSGAANLIILFGTDERPGPLPAEDAQRRLAGDHVPDRAERRLRCGRHNHPGLPDRRSADLPDQRHEDVHHRRRCGDLREHDPHGPGPPRGRRARLAGDRPVHRSEDPGQRGREPRAFQRRDHGQPGAQDGAQRPGDGPPQFRGERRLLRHPDGAAPRREGVFAGARHDVSHDERIADRNGPQRQLPGRRRLLLRFPVRDGTDPGPALRAQGCGTGAHHPARGCPADAPGHEGPHGGHPGHDLQGVLLSRHAGPFWPTGSGPRNWVR